MKWNWEIKRERERSHNGKKKIFKQLYSNLVCDLFGWRVLPFKLLRLTHFRVENANFFVSIRLSQTELFYTKSDNAKYLHPFNNLNYSFGISSMEIHLHAIYVIVSRKITSAYSRCLIKFISNCVMGERKLWFICWKYSVKEYFFVFNFFWNFGG